MENLFTRIKNIVVADLNGALDTKERQNPIMMLNEYLRQSELETEKVRKLLERQYQLKDEFTREYHQATELAAKRKNQAEIALNAGEIELQQFALHEANQYEERAARLNQLLEDTVSQLHELEKKYGEMKHKLKDMNIRRLELMGRENISRTYHRINQVVDNSTFTNNAYSKFQEIETYLERLESSVNHSYHHNTIDTRIAQLEKDMKKVDLLTK